MTFPPTLRRSLAIISALVLLWLASNQIPGSLNQLPQNNSVPQTIQVVTELISGIFAVVVPVMVFAWKEKAWIAEIVFMSACAVTAGLASVVWGGGSILVGIVSFVAAGLIAALLVWMLRVGVRHPEQVHP